MSQPSLTPILDWRTSAQRPREGAINVPHRWYQEFLDANPARALHGWSGISVVRRRARAEQLFPFGLRPDVIDKLSRHEEFLIKRLLNLVLALEDNLIFADPEWFPMIYNQREYRRLMRWAVSTEVHSLGSAIDQWKKFTQLVRWRVLRSLTTEPEVPENFPGIDRRRRASEIRLSPLWRRLAPWLCDMWDEGIENKFQCTRLAHFLTSRNMPAAGKKKREETLRVHREVLTTPGPDFPDRKEWLYGAAKFVGQSLRDHKQVSLKGAHLSVTNSASFLSPIKDGGRGVETAYKFRTWAMTIPTEDREGLTWFGQRFWHKAGTPQWRTMCRDQVAADGTPGDSSYIEDVDFTPGKFRYEDPLYCLDQYTGYQILQWALEEAIAAGYVEGTPYRSRTGLRLTGKYPFIRASAIGEPGNKSRVVTVTEGWLTILMQPYAHAFLEILKQDVEATAGLSRAWQGFEYVKRWAYKGEIPPEEERYILSSDLKTATDYCPQGYAQSLLKGFIDGLGFDTPFTHLWAELLTTPRNYVYEGGTVTTCRGVLMGDPGSKLVLSLFNKVAEMEANVRHRYGPRVRMSGKFLLRELLRTGIREPRFRLFAFAGDDHIAIGPIEYLRHITQSHIRNGMKVSVSTNYVSNIAGVYCEETIFIRDLTVWKYWGSKIPLYQSPYSENPHVDALKLRLLSLCRKEHEGKNEANPAIGMSSTLRGMIAWFAEGWESTRGIVSKRFRQKMRGLIPRNPFLAALPRELGGLECPVFDIPDVELEEAWEQIPDIHKRVIALVLKGGPKIEQSFRRILSQVPSMSALRGVDPESIEESIREVLSSDLCQARPVDSFRESLGFTELQWSQMRIRDKLHHISSKTEYISVGDAIQAVMRPYIFRDILFPEESLKHGICPFRTKAYANLHWERRFHRLYSAIEKLCAKSAKASEQIESVSEESLADAKDTALQSLGDPKKTNLDREVTFIPRSVVYTESLCTLQTPNLH